MQPGVIPTVDLRAVDAAARAYTTAWERFKASSSRPDAPDPRPVYFPPGEAVR